MQSSSVILLAACSGFDSVRRIIDSADLGGVRLREASTLRFEGRISTFFLRMRLIGQNS